MQINNYQQKPLAAVPVALKIKLLLVVAFLPPSAQSDLLCLSISVYGKQRRLQEDCQ